VAKKEWRTPELKVLKAGAAEGKNSGANDGTPGKHVNS
jgi:hypothetical protein